MSFIDFHTHAFPNALAPRAIGELESRADWSAVGDGTIGDLLRSMDEADIDMSVVATIATRPEQTRSILKWCGKVRSDRIEPLASVHPGDRKAVKWVARIADAGLAGIKLHPMYQDFAADESRLDAIYAAAAQRELIVTLHAGQDIAFPDDDRAAPRRIRNVVDRHPKLKLVATHLGGWRAWDEAAEHLIGCDVHLETSFVHRYLQPARAAQLITRHGPERILFGTDWPWRDQAEDIRAVGGMGLAREQTRRILWSNAARMLGY